MSFAPALPLAGYGGWRFLNRTLEMQQTAFSRSPALQRDIDHFRTHIGKVETAGDLVADRRLLRVALGAFGLDDDINNRFFIRKVLEEGTTDPKAMANRLSDKRYHAMASAFGFDNPEPVFRQDQGFTDRISATFMSRQFEQAVGAQDDSMRHALALQRELPALADRKMTEQARLYTVLGTPALRKVFETALGLPDSFAAIDLDRQVEVLRDRVLRRFGPGGVAQFAQPDRLEALTRQFMIQTELASPGMTNSPAGAALQLLQVASGKAATGVF